MLEEKEKKWKTDVLPAVMLLHDDSVQNSAQVP